MSSGCRLAPALGARIVGAALVVLAVLLLLATLLVAVLDASPGWLLGAGVAGVLAVAVLALLVRRVPVVQLDQVGYRVRWVRGAGVAAARWDEVAEAVAASPRGVDCVVLRLEDGRTTSIPVAAVAATREDFAEELRAHLRRGRGLQPW